VSWLRLYCQRILVNMNNIQLNPYLAFNGNCEEAMTFYKNVFGGELELNRFGDFGPESHKDKIMHAMLQADGITFMASDSPSESEVVFGTNISMSLSGTDEARLTQYFNDLATDGQIIMPMEKQSWGDTFGMVTDKFGLHWMVNISSVAPAGN
jgi:PhnB protein